MAVYSADGVLLTCNRAWDKAWEHISGLKGYSEWIGKSRVERRRLLGYCGPELINEAVAQRSSASTVLVNSNGELLLTTATPHYDSTDTLEYIVMNVRNLTYLNYLKDHLAQNECLFNQRDDLLTQRAFTLVKASGVSEIRVLSPAMRNVILLAGQLAALDMTVLLCGETGTGKQVIARLIHGLSRRAHMSFVQINCGAIPEGLVESELFGYQPGAFTGSLSAGKRGLIQSADGGTLFLDEIGELPLSSQAKLLKFLDDKLVLPLGSVKATAVDVRILAATNRNLHELVRAGTFRDDLLYRLEVIPLVIPPLRERREEIIPLAESFLFEFNREAGQESYISSELRTLLMSYGFPGNVRELKNLVARFVINARNHQVRLSDLPEWNLDRATRPGPHPVGATTPLAPRGDLLRNRLEEVERGMLEWYASQGLSTHEIARHIGIHHTSVMRKLKKYQIFSNQRKTH